MAGVKSFVQLHLQRRHPTVKLSPAAQGLLGANKGIKRREK